MGLVRFLGEGKITVEPQPALAPGLGEVLVRVEASALCGSELHAYRSPSAHPTGNPGHEAAGVIVDANGSEPWREGDRVGVSAVQGCGACAECQAGRYTYCPDRTVGSSWHADYLTCKAHACVRLPEDVPWEAGVLLSGDGLGVPYHSSRRTRPQAGETVAVFGCGPVGLSNVLLYGFLGCRVLAVDLSPTRRELARGLGAAAVLDGAGAVATEVRALTSGRGAEICLECAGRPETAALALETVATAGRVMLLGEQPRLQISPSNDLIRRDITLMGSWFYHFCECAEMLQLYRRGLRVDRLITHRFPRSQAAEAYRLFAAGETGKVILTPDEVSPGGLTRSRNVARLIPAP
jgi:threonine dehydrogenase-like Zn-dependent dehydrogenase